MRKRRKTQERKGKSRCKQLQAAFFISVRVSRSDFRIFASAPAASRRDKMSAAKLSLGHLELYESVARRRNERGKVAASNCKRLFLFRSVYRAAIFASSQAPLRQAGETK
ncbi:hypothetical protein D1165_10115 [Muribaculaceae bacterium M3]|nr:hypothetical protein [Muribaculaceae bacterium M3]